MEGVQLVIAICEKIIFIVENPNKKAFSGFWEEGPFGGEPNGPV